MTLLISHISALSYWRDNPDALCVCSRNDRIAATNLARKRLGEVPRASDADALGNFCGLPMFALANHGARRNSTKVRCVSWGSSLPDGSFAMTIAGNPVSSPEFVFLQMASRLDFVELVLLGYELCGFYSLGREGDGFLSRDRTLTSAAAIERFVMSAAGAKGAKSARVAIRYVIDGSASPRETALAMLLTLPYKRGGYGLPAPEMNGRIDFSGTANRASAKRYCRCDLLWRVEKVAVEYDSDTFHTTDPSFYRDSERKNALLANGLQVLTVTARNIASPVGLERTAVALSEVLGKRIRCRGSEKFYRAQRLLMSKVLYQRY